MLLAVSEPGTGLQCTANFDKSGTAKHHKAPQSITRDHQAPQSTVRSSAREPTVRQFIRSLTLRSLWNLCLSSRKLRSREGSDVGCKDATKEGAPSGEGGRKLWMGGVASLRGFEIDFKCCGDTATPNAVHPRTSKVFPISAVPPSDLCAAPA